MVVSALDLTYLAITRGGSLRSLEICRCAMFSEDGLVDIARFCKDLRKLRLEKNHINGNVDGYWLCELAFSNTVMESLHFHDPFDSAHMYDMEALTCLAKECSKSLVSLNVFPNVLSEFREVFKHAEKLDHFGTGIIKGWDYRGFEFPQNIRGLRIEGFQITSYQFLRPYLNQLRELDFLRGSELYGNCQCLLFRNCPSLEVLRTDDDCGNKGFQIIGGFCKKLRMLSHFGPVTHVGLKAVAQGCPDLEYLMVHPDRISNKALECVGNNLKKLRRLYIKDGGRVSRDHKLDEGVRAMLEGCRKLERLDIERYCGRLTNEGLRDIGEYGHNIRHLSLSYSGQSDAGFLVLLKGCSKLRKLKLDGCPFSKKAFATSVFNLNHSLRHVWLINDLRVLVLTRPMMGESRKKKHKKLKFKMI